MFYNSPKRSSFIPYMLNPNPIAPVAASIEKTYFSVASSEEK